MPSGFARPKSISFAPPCGEHDVSRLQVAVHDAVAVRDGQRLGHGDPNFENFVQRHRALAQSFRQSFAFQKLHHQVIGAILRSDVVELADMRMVQRRNRSAFALHALLQFRRGRKVRSQNFDGHRAIKAGITGAINLSHAACAQQRLDFVRTEFRARSESHSGSRNYSA